MQHARAELRKHSLHPLQLHRFVHTSQRVNAAGGGSTPTPVPNTAQSHAALLAALADGPVGVAKHLQLRAGLAGPQNTTSAPAAARTRFLAILLQAAHDTLGSSARLTFPPPAAAPAAAAPQGPPHWTLQAYHSTWDVTLTTHAAIIHTAAAAVAADTSSHQPHLPPPAPCAPPAAGTSSSSSSSSSTTSHAAAGPPVAFTKKQRSQLQQALSRLVQCAPGLGMYWTYRQAEQAVLLRAGIALTTIDQVANVAPLPAAASTHPPHAANTTTSSAGSATHGPQASGARGTSSRRRSSSSSSTSSNSSSSSSISTSTSSPDIQQHSSSAPAAPEGVQDQGRTSRSTDSHGRSAAGSGPMGASPSSASSSAMAAGHNHRRLRQRLFPVQQQEQQQDDELHDSVGGDRSKSNSRSRSRRSSGSAHAGGVGPGQVVSVLAASSTPSAAAHMGLHPPAAACVSRRRSSSSSSSSSCSSIGTHDAQKAGTAVHVLSDQQEEPSTRQQQQQQPPPALLLPNVRITLAPFSAPEPVRPPLPPAMVARPLATAVLLLLLEVWAVQSHLLVKDEAALCELLVLWHTQFLRRNPSLKARLEGCGGYHPELFAWFAIFVLRRLAHVEPLTAKQQGLLEAAGMADSPGWPTAADSLLRSMFSSAAGKQHWAVPPWLR